MANPHKTATAEDWQKLGELCKRINRDLLDACVLASKMMGLKDWRYLDHSATKFNYFRSHAEDVMFMKGGPQDIRIFYGPEPEGKNRHGV